jgi:DNA modification methylase
MTKVLDQASGNGWHLYNADTVEVCASLPESSIDFSVYSPPFAFLYCYSNSDRDLGNCRTHGEFGEHFGHLMPSLFRVLRPGRLMAIHCMLIPTSKVRDGYIGLRDFRGEMIRAAQAAGFVFHSEVTIWKDPVMQMQRTKAKGLLHMQLRKDSVASRQGMADYLVVVVKPGENTKPISHTHDDFPVERWQRYASPVWATSEGEDGEGFTAFRNPRKGDTETDASGIDQGDTLQYMAARDGDDERHIAPLQLGVIRRAIRLWTAPGDVVLSPFAGIGSEGYVALQEGRRFVGAELKASYYQMAARNLAAAEPNAKGKTLAMFGDPCEALGKTS